MCNSSDPIIDWIFLFDVITLPKPNPESHSQSQSDPLRREILSNVIQCLKILLEEVQVNKELNEVDGSLENTAIGLKELRPDEANSQAKLWEYSDSILALWEDPAIQVTC